MQKNYVLGVPHSWSTAFIALCWIGILIGSFRDLAISQELGHPHHLAKLISTYGSLPRYLVIVLAGVCLQRGINLLGSRRWGHVATFCRQATLWLAVYYSDRYCGANFRDWLHFPSGSIWCAFWAWIIWCLFYSLVSNFFEHYLKNDDARALITIGVVVLAGSYICEILNSALELLASRPRFSYLATLTDPATQFRAWWQLHPYESLAGNVYGSFPSGHVLIGGTFLCVPMFADVLRGDQHLCRCVLFIVSLLFLLAIIWARLAQQAHFVSDLSLSALICYSVYARLEKLCHSIN